MDKTLLALYEGIKEKYIVMQDELHSAVTEAIQDKAEFIVDNLTVSVNSDYMGEVFYIECSAPAFGAGFTIKYDVKRGFEYCTGGMRFSSSNKDVVNMQILMAMLLKNAEAFEDSLKTIQAKYGVLVYENNSALSKFRSDNAEFMKEYRGGS